MSNRRRGLSEFLAKHPTCIFCGGSARAVTQDHVPSRQLCVERWWPEGYAFPSCSSCNQSTKRVEQIVAMFSRIGPGDKTPREKREIKQIIAGVRNNDPNVLLEMWPTEQQVQELLGRPWAPEMLRTGAIAPVPFSVGGPRLNQCMREYARKLFSALHYKEFGKIIPPQGGIFWQWFSNVQRLDGKMPDEFIGLLGQRAMVRRTTRDLSDQFSYTFEKAKDGEFTGYFATFRRSFAMLGVIEMDTSSFTVEGNRDQILRPRTPTHEVR